MAQIGYAQIDTLHIEQDAVTGVDKASAGAGVNISATATADNPVPLPVQIDVTGAVTYFASSSGQAYSYTVTLRRVSDNAVLATETFALNGTGTKTRSINFGAFDASAGSFQDYRIEGTAVRTNGDLATGGWTSLDLSVIWTKL